MTIIEQIEYWINLSDQDIPVAESLLKNQHYTWCLFIGHLVLEKILKAAYLRDNQKHPPKHMI